MLFLIAISALIGVVIVAYFLDLFSFNAVKKVGFTYWKERKLAASLFQVDEFSKKHGGMLVADVLQAHGVKHIFTLVGGHISPILASCQGKEIKVVDVRHEASAVFAADAAARLGQTIGVAAVTAGPGVTNTVTAIQNAVMAESPVLLMGGAAAGLLKGRGALQDINQMALLKPLCKFTATISRIRDIVPTLKKAIQIAQSGTPGPVFVEFPIDTLYPYHLVHREMGINPNPRSLMQKIINGYLILYLCKLFNNAWKRHDLTPLPVKIPLPLPSQVSSVIDMIRAAERPVMLIGSQSVSAPVPVDTLRKAVEAVDIPCFLGGMSRGLLGRKGKLHVRQQRKDALKEADLIILAGIVADFRLGYGRVLGSKAKIISINRNKEQLLKNSDMFWKPSLAIQADVATTLDQVATGLVSGGHAGGPVSWLATLRQRDDEKESKNSDMAAMPTQSHLNPLAVLEKLEEVLPEDAIIVADGGDFVGSAAYILRPRGPLQWLDPGAFGTLGVGGGFALGAKITCPDRPVWIIYGDGAFGFSMAEIDSFVRHNAPVTSVIGNDACWMQIYRDQINFFGTDVACSLSYCPYEKVAEGLGAIGHKLDRENESMVEKMLNQAVEDNNRGKSVVLNVLIGSTKFREGSISV